MESQTVVDNPTAPVLDDEARALRLAIDHARRGNAVAARILLVDICSRNPNNELAWLWRASLATTADEGLSYMDQVLRLNPQNRTALGWLAKMGRPAPTPAEKPAAPAAVPAAVAAVPVSAVPVSAAPVSAAPEVAPAGEKPAVAAPKASEPRKRTQACPVCFSDNEPGVARCPTCRSVLLINSPIDFAVSRSIDPGLIAAALEHWQPLAASGSIDAELALTTVYLNLLDYARAAHHLKQALQRGLPVPAPALFADGAVMKALMNPVVMVVDDSATIRDVVVRTLGSSDILPLPVGNPWEVVEAIRTQKPALVLLDVTMPGIDGLELCRKIRGTKEIRHTPVVMLTGHDALIDKLVGKMAGATEYLTKPFKPEVLLRTVRKYLEKRRAQ